jgi:hypothetical protein
MTHLPWPQHKDRSGHTFVTYKLKRYKVPGTGANLKELVRAIRAGEAQEVEEE